MFLKEKPDKNKKQKKQIMLYNMSDRLSVYVDNERLEYFMTEVPITQKPVTRTSIMK